MKSKRRDNDKAQHQAKSDSSSAQKKKKRIKKKKASIIILIFLMNCFSYAQINKTGQPEQEVIKRRPTLKKMHHEINFLNAKIDEGTRRLERLKRFRDIKIKRLRQLKDQKFSQRPRETT